MKNRVLITVTSFMLAGIFAAAQLCAADDIKTRMIGRVKIINKELKAKGIVGENNRGYLESRSGKKQREDVIKAENRDRKTIYTQIAKQQGTTAEVVGKHRAVQLQKKAKAGDWLQDTAGTWYRK